MKTLCPNCSTDQEVPDEYSGKTVNCNECKKDFTASKYTPVIHPAKPATKPQPGPYHIYYETPEISHTLWIMSVVIIIISALCSIGAKDGGIILGGIVAAILFIAIGCIADRLGQIHTTLRNILAWQKYKNKN